MYSWPKIGSLKDASHYASKIGLGAVTFTGTVKLHGTNAGVFFTKDFLIPQSRNRVLSVGDDNLGFASWLNSDLTVEATLRVFESELRSFFRLDPEDNIVLFGEWCGKGIQKGMALNQLPTKQWVLFGAHRIRMGETLPLDLHSFYLANRKATKTKKPFYDIMSILREQQVYFIYEAGTWDMTFNMSKPKELEIAKGQIEALTQSVEDNCPWGANFGVQGLGEGIVWTDPTLNPNLTFKSKGKQHKVASISKTCVERIPNVSVFVEEFLTEERLGQGISYLEEMNLPTSMQGMSHFLKWVGNDIKTEGALRLEELQLTWQDVSKLVNHHAVTWFKNRGD